MSRTTTTAADKKRRLARILRGLERMHGPRTWESRGPCLDVLVRNFLAQNTNLVNARRGYDQLRRNFRSWTEVMNADVSAVQRHIAVCGLARMRARRLQALLRKIKTDHGKLDLQFLADVPEDVATDYLLSFHGIGPQTASCTLLFALGVPLFPVDNGILRVCRRLRLCRLKARHPEAQQAVEKLSTAPQRYPLHVLMFAHSKKLCRPKNPKCDECRLLDLCPHGKRRVRHQPVEEPLPKRMRPVILSKYASAGIPKRGWRDADE